MASMSHAIHCLMIGYWMHSVGFGIIWGMSPSASVASAFYFIISLYIPSENHAVSF